MRSTITTSAPSTARSKSVIAWTPSSSTRGGSSVGGPQTVTLAPIRVRRKTFDRATRECAMSPAMTTFSPSIRPNRSRIVKASRSACVGCSWAPSPALMTPASRCRARKCGTPAAECRTTIRSGDIAWRVRAVSSRDSPFSTDVPFPPLKLSESAESHFSAVSKEKRVRVEASKKRLTTMRPRSAGTFLIGRAAIDRMDSAVSRRRVISPTSRCSIPRRSLERSAVIVCRLAVTARRPVISPIRDFRFPISVLRPRPLQDPDLVGGVGFAEHDLDDLALRRRDALADVVRLDRELAVPPVDQNGQADGARTAEVDDSVERRPDGAAGVVHVGAEDHGAVVQVELDLGLLQERLRGDHGEIVPIQRDVQRPDRKRGPDQIRETLGEPGGERNSSRSDPDKGEASQILLALRDLVCHPVDHPADALRVEDLRLFEEEGFRQVRASLRAARARVKTRATTHPRATIDRSGEELPMVFYNASTRELTAKIVYYGPGLCGKTTNLQVLHRHLDPGTAGELLALSTESDRTIYFDLLPVELGDIKGYTIRFQLATVPGQTAFNETRRIVLKGADSGGRRGGGGGWKPGRRRRTRGAAGRSRGGTTPSPDTRSLGPGGNRSRARNRKRGSGALRGGGIAASRAALRRSGRGRLPA